MDLSQQYHTLLNQSGPILNDTEILELSRRYRVILLKGFLGDVLPKRFDSYFFDQMRWMRDHGIDYWRLEADSGYGTQKLPQNNGDAIAKAVRTFHQQQPDKRILLVSHSKGGIDALEALLRRNDSMDGEPAGWIALQAPFRGTPVANWATENRLFNPLVERLLGGLFKGDTKVAASMTVDARSDYMTRNSRDILNLAERLDILAFASSCAPGDSSLFRPLRFTIDQIARVRNDGLLPTHSEILEVDGSPCCPYVETEHLDHIYAVLPLMPDKNRGASLAHKTRRIRIFNALLKIWMDHRKSD
ncbi:MAG: esterase/lipase family protein [Gammaproteobacteria bacterium]